ncbi:LytTR family DNA-binding domain-containing protein [Peribacillus frigoritolerans]|nr:LytTR family DNA-binding domain-containing protein [Peribacillus frigoritolerans]
MKERLYELERDLPGNQFVRLSKSVIANLDELSRFEASFNGTLCVYFRSGEKRICFPALCSRDQESISMEKEGIMMKTLLFRSFVGICFGGTRDGADVFWSDCFWGRIIRQWNICKKRDRLHIMWLVLQHGNNLL